MSDFSHQCCQTRGGAIFVWMCPLSLPYFVLLVTFVKWLQMNFSFEVTNTPNGKKSVYY